MTIINKKEPILVGIGDFLILVFSLWLTLVVRYHSLPVAALWFSHFTPFIYIFVYSVLVFYIAGLYGQYGVFIRSRIPFLIIKAQLVNAVLAVVLFYFNPSFEVSPKTTLFIYFILASCFLIIWRVSVFSFSGFRTKRRALIINTGKGPEANELANEMNSSPRSYLECVGVIDNATAASKSFQDTLLERIEKDRISHIVLDMNDASLDGLLPELYKGIFKNVHYVDINNLYEELFGRIPLSSIKYAWVLENVSPSSPRLYDALKRVIDIVLSLILGVVTLVFLPFVWIAIKIEDRGRLLIMQNRVGKSGRNIEVYKFRSMSRNEDGVWLGETENKVTRVGYFLRKSRIDELPQVWSVLKGDLSLIGPRWDMKDLRDRLEQQIPYYSIRTIIKPGLSGWAQINQEKPPQSIEESELRHSYDLYYIKHRSLGLDIRIALKTIKTLLSLVGM